MQEVEEEMDNVEEMMQERDRGDRGGKEKTIGQRS